MELRWREGWKRSLIEMGYREGLSVAEVARRGNVCTRSVRRWWKEYCEDGRSQTIAVSSFPPVPPFQFSFEAPAQRAVEPERSEPPVSEAPAILNEPLIAEKPPLVPEPLAPAPAALMGFAQVTEAPERKADQIRIDLAEGGRVTIEGVFNVETLSRLIAAMRGC